MNIAIISASTFPASLPEDVNATQGYGSESYNAILARALANAGHDIDFYAPTGSSRFVDNDKVIYHPLENTHGQHAANEILDISALDKSKYTDLLSKDFIISGEKLCHNIEELYYTQPTIRKYCCYRSGYADYFYPLGVPTDRRHYVTHCRYFQEQFKKAGHESDVAFFGIPEFWSPINRQTDEYWMWFEVHYKLSQKGYWLYPHRPSPDKGIDQVLKVAQIFPDETFVISTASPLPDHKATMKRCKQIAKDGALNNVKFVEVPESPYYQYHRRSLICNAKAVLCPYPYPSQYLDTGGLVGAESMRCGTPIIVTRSPGSEEWWGAQDDQGVVFINGVDGLKMVIKDWSTYNLKPHCPYTTEAYANNYMEIIKKYTT